MTGGMMFKGTPGPWIWADRNQGLYGAGPDNAVLAFYSYEGMHLSGKTAEAQEANAKLISAAPELLEAVLMLQKQALQSELNNPNHEWGLEALAAARAAIAKALGEQK